MFDIGISELALIAIAALLALGPKEMMGLARSLNGYVRSFRRFVAESKQQVRDALGEDELQEIKTITASTRTIIDLEGKPQIAYDVSELEGLHEKKSPHTSSS